MQNAGHMPKLELAHETIDMSPTLSTQTYNRLVAALEDGAAIADGAAKFIPPQERFFSKQDRQAITNANMTLVLDQLTFSSDRLAGAMHRIGYLESQVETMEDRLRFLPEFRAKAAQSIVLERQNWELKDVIEQRNMQLIRRERIIEDKDQQIAILEKVLAAHKKHLAMVESDLEKLEANPWVRFWAWFSGMPLPKP